MEGDYKKMQCPVFKVELISINATLLGKDYPKDAKNRISTSTNNVKEQEIFLQNAQLLLCRWAVLMKAMLSMNE